MIALYFAVGGLDDEQEEDQGDEYKGEFVEDEDEYE